MTSVNALIEGVLEEIATRVPEGETPLDDRTLVEELRHAALTLEGWLTKARRAGIIVRVEWSYSKSDSKIDLGPMSSDIPPIFIHARREY